MDGWRNAVLNRWNWKSAFLSSLFRGLIFFTTTWSSGWQAAMGAMAAESLLRSVTAGFYGGLTQQLRLIEPAWKGAALALLVLPSIAHSIEFAMHRLRGTPHLAAGMRASIAFTVISTLFHLHATRRGAFLSGTGSAPLSSDLRRTPELAAGFLLSAAILARRAARTFRSSNVLAIPSQNSDPAEN